ncbi:hypothetical protein COLO4_23278 [Corchorus olitorius]|uniref:Uncharacterized protein n=1 Tax=Corchorus olitorius TaxID=93759 RepID=A0A1R3IHK5_9ROSI|nr:hypothetical protein COLO4_23278 [Corchorus olitorius]
MLSCRLAKTVPRSYLALYAAAQNKGLFRRIASGAAVKGGTADPTIHSGELETGPEVHRGEAQGIENSGERHRLDHESQTETEPRLGFEKEPLYKAKLPHGSSQKLESSPVNHPLEPNFQQRRSISAEGLNDVSCAGLDGSPWPESKENRQSDRKKQEMDDKEYYSHHKASPLSEIEVADTRKPITRATDGSTAKSGKDVIGWLPEQLDTAEDSLLRANRIWKENAARGIPELPHSRRLRELRGEWF